MIFRNPTGGLFYFIRAYRYKKKLWKSYLDQVAKKIQNDFQESKKIILVGPSAGFSFSKKWIKQFEEVICVDIDPFACLLFKMRFESEKIKWVRKNLFFDSKGKEIGRGFFDFLEKHPNHAVLFCNFLGQMKLLISDSEAESLKLKKFFMNLPSQMTKRTWASFHDKLSGELKPNEKVQYKTTQLLGEQACAKIFYQKSANGELISHQVDLPLDFLFTHVTYFSWEISPGVYHLIEYVHSRS